jgi:1,2-dihydroxy-3-keto-5-methylthiopentene dioxygenase
MAVVRVPEEARTIRDPEAIREYLASIDIQYKNWKPSCTVSPDASADEVLRAFAEPIEELKKQGGYVTADVIDVNPNTPNLDTMLAKFSKEHWHDEDEVRYIVEGRGLFHIHPPGKPVVAIEVEAGDLIRVPRGTHHWFDLCGDRRIRAIRLFQDTAGWTPHYTGTGVDAGFQPVCLGAKYIPHHAGSAND